MDTPKRRQQRGLDDLPFFQDEFVMRATNPTAWDEVVALGNSDTDDGEEEEDEQEAISRILRLLGSGDETWLPIIGRRLACRLRGMQSERGKAALATLEACIARQQEQHHPNEDDGDDDAAAAAAGEEEEEEPCPSLPELEALDNVRVSFIQSGKWTDHSLSFEHYLELERALLAKRQRDQASERKQDLFAVLPGLVLVPFVWFLVLVCSAPSNATYGMHIALVCFLFAQAAFEWWGVVVVQASRRRRRRHVRMLRVVPARVLAVLTMLLLGAFSVLVAVATSFPAGVDNTALGLMQLAVCVLNLSLLRDQPTTANRR